MLSMALTEASAKVRNGPPDDDNSDDAALDVWAGELPITHFFQQPIASPGLREGIPVPPSVRRVLGAPKLDVG